MDEFCVKGSGEARDYNAGIDWCSSQGMDVLIPYNAEINMALLTEMLTNLGKANIYFYFYLKTSH